MRAGAGVSAHARVMPCTACAAAPCKALLRSPCLLPTCCQLSNHGASQGHQSICVVQPRLAQQVTRAARDAPALAAAGCHLARVGLPQLAIYERGAARVLQARQGAHAQRCVVGAGAANGIACALAAAGAGVTRWGAVEAIVRPGDASTTHPPERGCCLTTQSMSLQGNTRGMGAVRHWLCTARGNAIFPAANRLSWPCMPMHKPTGARVTCRVAAAPTVQFLH